MSKFKLIITIIGSVLAVAIITGGVILISNAVKKNKQNKCEHEYGEFTIVTDATCETDGLQTQVCGLCEYENAEVIPAFGHTEFVLNAKPATCLESGLSDGISCKTCNKTIVPQVTIPSLGHNIVTDNARPATCVTFGLTQGSHCKRCNHITKAQEKIPAKGHVIAEIEGYAATCTTPGLTKGSYCSNCNTVYSEQEEIEAIGHNFIDGICATCGITEEVPVMHSFRNGFCDTCGIYEYVYDDASLYVEEDVKVGDVVDGWYRMYRDDMSDMYFTVKCNTKNPTTGEITATNGIVNFYVCSKQSATTDEKYNAVAMFIGQSGPMPHEDIIAVAYDDYVDIFLYGGCEISYYFENNGNVIIDTIYMLQDSPTISSIYDGFTVKRLVKVLPEALDQFDTTLATEVDVTIGEKVAGNWYRLYRSADISTWKSMSISCLATGIVNQEEVNNNPDVLSFSIFNTQYIAEKDCKDAIIMLPTYAGPEDTHALTYIVYDEYVDIFLAAGTTFELVYEAPFGYIYNCSYTIDEDSEILTIDSGLTIKRLVNNHSGGAI